MKRTTKIVTPALPLSIFLLLFMLSFEGFGQYNGAQLPQGFGVNALQASENLSSGVLNINLPIESTLVPVSIGYTTSGIRVNHRAGVVGLGWNLSAGGSITRQKRNINDSDDNETDNMGDSNGYSGEGPSGFSPAGAHMKIVPNEDRFDEFTFGDNDEYWDSEPDIFNFQFGGQGGMFTIDHDQTVVKLTPNNLKIEPNYTIAQGYYTFDITDEQGNKYHFGPSEFIETKNGSDVVDYYRYKWNLSSITDYKTVKQITFEYESATDHSRTNYYNWQQRTYSSTGIGNWVADDPNDLYTTTYKLGKRLQEITYEDSKITFNYGSRTDVPSLKRLTSIEYWNNGDKTLTYNFKYNYLGAGSASRLMLSSVSKSTLGIVLYQFFYFGEEGGETLPEYSSTQQDHWGFYNNNPYSTLFEHLGANRLPSLSHTMANSLKKIYYTSGGVSEYEYELNKYKSGATEVAAGGLRIAKVYQDDGEGDRYVASSYDYKGPDGKSSAELYAEPLYESLYKRYNDSDTRIYKEHSLSPLADDMGRHISYEFVTVTQRDGGTIKNRFYTFIDDIVKFGTGSQAMFTRAYKKTAEKYYSTISYATIGNYPGTFGNRDFKGTCVGRLEEQEIRDNLGNLLKRDTYEYTTKLPSATVMGMNNMMRAKNKIFTNIPWVYFTVYEYWLSFYELGNGYLLPTKTTSTIYDPTDQLKYVTSVSETTYDPDHLLPISQKQYNLLRPSETTKTTTDYYFRDTAAPAEVLDNNLLALPKMQSTLVQGVEQNRTESIYIVNNTSNKVQMSEQKGHQSNILVGHNKFYYDAQGLLCESEDVLQQYHTAQLWDTEGRRIIAQMSNAKLSQVAFSSFENGNKGGWTMPDLKYDLECVLNSEVCEEVCPSWLPDNMAYDQCLDACNTDYNDCMDLVNTSVGFMGENAYQLSSGTISKSLEGGKEYILSYWFKNGSVYLSGEYYFITIKTEVHNGWTYKEQRVLRTSPGSINLSGNAEIDQLKIHPIDAQMTTTLYHPVFGKSAQTDANNNTIFYEYDVAGRPTLIKDKNEDIISKTDHHIFRYIDLSSTSLSPTYGGGTYDVFITSNDTWTVSDNASWVSVSPVWGDGFDKLVVTVDPSSNTNSQNATVTISGANAPNKTIDITQGAAPANYITVSPENISFSYTYQSIDIDVFSNTSWSASILFQTSSGDLTVYEWGAPAITIVCNQYRGGSGFAVVLLTASTGLTGYVAVMY